MGDDRASGGGLWISRTGSGQMITLSHRSSDSESGVRRRGMSEPGESQIYWRKRTESELFVCQRSKVNCESEACGGFVPS